MAGPSKQRVQRQEKQQKQQARSADNSSASRPTQGSINKYDGNRDPDSPGQGVMDYTRLNDLKNLSEFLGMAGWCVARGFAIPSSLPQRPKNFNTYGKEATITLNTFNVIKPPSIAVHQYDVSYTGDGKDYSKRALVQKIWRSNAVQTELSKSDLWIWDGNKLAWSGKRLPRDDNRITVDLDAEEGRAPKAGKGNTHTVHLRHTRQVDFHGLSAWLKGQTGWSTEYIDTINFFDHLLREGPSQRYTQIKKSFFQRGEQRFDLGGGIEAFKGVFASLRPVLDDKFNKSLSINVDVANGTFWRAQGLGNAISQMFNGCTIPQLSTRFKEAQKNWKQAVLRRDFASLKRVGVTATHVQPHVQYTIDSISDMNPNQCMFPDPDDRRPGVDDKDRKQISLAVYFKKKYNVTCAPGLPVVKMTKKIRGKNIYMPVEVLRIDPNQRYNSKLSDTQTSQMIKFAVTLPRERWAAVEQGVRLLDWQGDKYLKHYGLQISPSPSKVKARILPSPTVQFGTGSKEPTIKPQDLIAGRWRLDGRKFAMTNKDRPIKGWGICVIQGRHAPDVAAVRSFAQKFIQIYESHGGVFAAHPTHGKLPWMGPGNLGDGGELVQKVWNQTGNRYNAIPMFLMFVVMDRNVEVYRRIKKSCDIRFGVPSQVLQAKHVMSASPQYISNVCMKVNAKLGGATCITKSSLIPKINPKCSVPTMVVGADVSHPAPGAGSEHAASFAAITVSADPYFAKYWADVNTNGNRVEMITTTNIQEQFGNMARNWMQRLGQGKAPERLLYIRDGVSEGQYETVIKEEVHDMKAFFAQFNGDMPKFTVLIAGKRHHVRFFPEKGDRNGNPIPGTLVETGCTHPFEFDFYMCSHVAIKGTARPIHYHCIMNEGQWQAAELQQFVFEHSYQYARSTTPVSLHPAVYYAHIAADRARAHVTDAPVSSGKKESKPAPPPTSETGSSNKRGAEVPPLMKIQNARGLKDVMWFI
ncbi:hypothetical protein E8E13_009910 [Curvularia kusanoi]|uniref:Uncharacterized protein n=1 Tax=Curvularia kusanoi TaxID=90978 RepID=A0A9P4TIW1_CURKU|nr:hypothetical protein E8E13_009910 [Curvularia kusanoi]